MLIDIIRPYYAYSDWANERIFSAAEGLSSEQFLQSDLPGVWPIRDSLVHIQWANRIWLGRWRGDAKRIDLKASDFPDVESIRAAARQISGEIHAFLDSLDDEQVGAEFTYTNHLQEQHAFPLGMQLLHVANHATYHRGESAALLTRFGCSPGEIDITRWMAWKAGSEVRRP